MPDPEQDTEPKQKIGCCERCGEKNFKSYDEYISHILDC